jgi:hypothetical protein
VIRTALLAALVVVLYWRLAQKGEGEVHA